VFPQDQGYTYLMGGGGGGIAVDHWMANFSNHAYVLGNHLGKPF
jgi:hypothetical protein